jgi:hypothetical protein
MYGQVDDRIQNSEIQESTLMSVLDDPERILALARDYFCIAFPNPDRVGCTAPNRIAETIGSGESRLDDWYKHIFRCSECFREYREQPPHLRTLLKSEAGKIIMYEFLDELNFFIPTAQLTEDIIVQNRKLAQQDLQRARREDLDAEFFEHEFRGERRNSASGDSPEGQQRFVDRCMELVRNETLNDHEKLNHIMRQSQLEIAETLYGYLAVLARRQEAFRGEPYNIWLVIPQGMGSRLGLMRSVAHLRHVDFEANKYRLDDEQLFDDNSRMLLTEFTKEFRLWLSHQQGGTYDRAPWGVMHLEDEDHLFLRAAPQERRRRRPTRHYEGEAHYGPSSEGFERWTRK